MSQSGEWRSFGKYGRRKQAASLQGKAIAGRGRLRFPLTFRVPKMTSCVPFCAGVPATMSALKCGACSSKPGSLGERVLGGVPCAAGRGEEGELAGASPELAASPHPCWSKISHPHI